MAGINDLPIELYELIFRNNLSIKDLFNCRLVNKQFKFATYESVRKLVVGESDDYSKEFWFHNNELIDYDDVISLKCFKKIRTRSIFNLDKYLKYLKININGYDFYEFKKELLNSNYLINLECLEIFDGNHCIDFKLDINLNNLKYFKLDNRHSTKISCKLNAPKLKKIELYEFDESQFLIKSNLDSIKHLITYYYEDQLKKFKNLEIIKFIFPTNLNENLLSFFNNLKQLKIGTEREYFYGFFFSSESEDCLIKLLEKREELNRRDIDIYFCGVKIINIDQLKELYIGNIFDFQLNNYDLLDSTIPIITQLNYSELNNHYDNLRNDLPSSFFDKFLNISDVDVYVNKNDKPIDADNLNWFLNNLKCLRKLIIKKVILDQNFFNNLPITIRELSISEFSELGSVYSNINFNFILKLTKLINFYQYGWSIDLFDLTLSSFSNLKYLDRFEFEYKGIYFTIKKEDKSIFKFRVGLGIENKLDYDQLTKKCNQLRLE